MGNWVSTALIVLPAAGALVLWLLPWPRVAVGAVALAVSLAEVGLWIAALVDFDFADGGFLQYEEQATWFGELGISYHVGFYGFGLWLAGLAVVCQAAAVAYAMRAGRERPRAYFGLMLLLTGAIVGVFCAQDLLLFYVFWEAMLIPLYLLVGVWGGEGRQRATLLFVIYTMVGSLLMLASIIVFGLSEGTFDIGELRTAGGSTWLFLGFVAAFAVRRRCSPSTDGCRRRTARHRRRWPASSPVSCPRRPRTGSSTSRSSSSRAPPPTSACRYSRSRPSASCTAPCSRSGRATSAA
jgi:NADH-quinone oxidoreductase subunit M